VLPREGGEGRSREAVDRSGYRVLVVDDDANALAALAALLEDHGFVVEMASDGLQTLPKARELEPDILVVDITTGISARSARTFRARSSPLR
jgi:DNA-binding response OmpR family regulator